MLISDIRVNILENCRSNRVWMEDATVEDVEHLIVGDETIRQMQEEYRAMTDEDEAKKFKGGFHAVNVHGYSWKKRCTKQNVDRPTGIICADIDHVVAEEVKQQILGSSIAKHCVLIPTTLSGKGICVWIPYNLNGDLTHEQNVLAAYYTVSEMFAKLGLELDTHCKDISRLRYLSHDAQCIYNPDAEPIDLYPSGIENAIEDGKNKTPSDKKAKTRTQKTGKPTFCSPDPDAQKRWWTDSPRKVQVGHRNTHIVSTAGRLMQEFRAKDIPWEQFMDYMLRYNSMFPEPQPVSEVRTVVTYLLAAYKHAGIRLNVPGSFEQIRCCLQRTVKLKGKLFCHDCVFIGKTCPQV